MATDVAVGTLPVMTTSAPQPRNTTAFYLQSVIAFGVSLFGTMAGIYYLPLDPWPKGYLVMSMLFLVTASFTLAKVVRDKQDEQLVKEARMEKLILQKDPVRPVA